MEVLIFWRKGTVTVASFGANRNCKAVHKQESYIAVYTKACDSTFSPKDKDFQVSAIVMASRLLVCESAELQEETQDDPLWSISSFTEQN